MNQQRTPLTGLENAPVPPWAQQKSVTYKLTEAEVGVLGKYSAGLIPDKDGRMVLKGLVDMMIRDLRQRGYFICEGAVGR